MIIKFFNFNLALLKNVYVYENMLKIELKISQLKMKIKTNLFKSVPQNHCVQVLNCIEIRKNVDFDF